MQLYAKVFGESHAETILFIPGMTGSHASWNDDFQSLSRNYRLVMIDTLGFGHSPKPEIAYSLDEHLSAISDTLKELDVRHVHIVGHSMGTLLTLETLRSLRGAGGVELAVSDAARAVLRERATREQAGSAAWIASGSLPGLSPT